MTEALFPTEQLEIPIAAQIACVEREIFMREHVYKRRVTEEKMSQAKADEELAAMRAVLATLKGAPSNEREQEAAPSDLYFALTSCASQLEMLLKGGVWAPDSTAEVLAQARRALEKDSVGENVVKAGSAAARPEGGRSTQLSGDHLTDVTDRRDGQLISDEQPVERGPESGDIRSFLQRAVDDPDVTCYDGWIKGAAAALRADAPKMEIHPDAADARRYRLWREFPRTMFAADPSIKGLRFHPSRAPVKHPWDAPEQVDRALDEALASGLTFPNHPVVPRTDAKFDGDASEERQHG